MTAPVETCEACRFDGAQYDVQDSLGTLRAVVPMWRHTIEGIDTDLLATRPATDAWSVAEHVSHTANVVDPVASVLQSLLTLDGAQVAALPTDPAPDTALRDDALLASPGGAGDAIERLRAGLDRVSGLTTGLQISDPVWQRPGTVGGETVDALWALRHLVHAATHHLTAAGRTLHRLGAGAPTQTGTVAQLSVSGGGVPKLPVEAVEVTVRGLDGDRQAARKHHGRPWQALSLWSAEVIDALRDEGHPIAPGAAGENVTVAGIDWATIRPGVRLRLGDVAAEISAYATPCKKNAQWFAGGDITRMLHDRHPGWSRAYAWVREPGRVAAGDEVVVEP